MILAQQPGAGGRAARTGTYCCIPPEVRDTPQTQVDSGSAVEDAIDQVIGADLVLVASPTSKGTYTGLLKVFVDRLPHRALDRTAAVPLMLMGGTQHASAADAPRRSE